MNIISTGSADVCADGQSSETGMAPGCSGQCLKTKLNFHQN